MMNPELGLVYVVDDDASVRRSIERLAQSMGLEARGFATGLEFLAARREPRRACVVLDQRLPDMHGLDVQRQLARTDPELPVIVITAHGDEFSRREALAARAVAFLAKPFDDNSLREAIWRSLGGKPR
jgi:FixJ family two-component response regulator